MINILSCCFADIDGELVETRIERLRQFYAAEIQIVRMRAEMRIQCLPEHIRSTKMSELAARK